MAGASERSRVAARRVGRGGGVLLVCAGLALALAVGAAAEGAGERHRHVCTPTEMTTSTATEPVPRACGEEAEFAPAGNAHAEEMTTSTATDASRGTGDVGGADSWRDEGGGDDGYVIVPEAGRIVPKDAPAAASGDGGTDIAAQISLPPAHVAHGTALSRALAARRSVRALDPTAEPLALEHVAQVLWSSQGITAPAPPRDALGHEPSPRRTCPSGGAVYPLSLFLIAAPGGVAGLEGGVYRYLPHEHALQPMGDAAGAGGEGPSAHAAAVQSSSPHEATVDYACQPWLRNSSALLLLAGDASATRSKGGFYTRIAEDLVTLEAGMAAQNALLAAAALNVEHANGLAATPVGAFESDELRAALRGALRACEAPKIMIAMGTRLTGLSSH